MDFHALQGPYGSRLKFWTVPQGLRPLRILAVFWNPGRL